MANGTMRSGQIGTDFTMYFMIVIEASRSPAARKERDPSPAGNVRGRAPGPREASTDSALVPGPAAVDGHSEMEGGDPAAESRGEGDVEEADQAARRPRRRQGSQLKARAAPQERSAEGTPSQTRT